MPNPKPSGSWTERMRWGWERWNAGDPSATVELLAEDVVYVDGFLPDQSDTEFTGIGGIMEAWGRWLEPWEEITTRVVDVIEGEGKLVTVHDQSAVAKGSGAPVQMRFAYVWEHDGHRVTRFESFRDPADALASAGLGAS